VYKKLHFLTIFFERASDLHLKAIPLTGIGYKRNAQVNFIFESAANPRQIDGIWHVFGPNLRGQAMFYQSYDKIECKNVQFSYLFGV
jgi:hypothetical protein